eukprot:8652202-Alexandrium_andersonii.AAC.1
MDTDTDTAGHIDTDTDTDRDTDTETRTPNTMHTCTNTCTRRAFPAHVWFKGSKRVAVLGNLPL